MRINAGKLIETIRGIFELIRADLDPATWDPLQEVGIYTCLALLAIVIALIIEAMIREGIRAIRETRARQRAWNPRPKTDRARVAAIRKRRAQAEALQLAQLEDERRQAAAEAEARKTSRAAGAPV